ncbi:MAG TPA: hypothetical protein VKK31_27185 [Thermoanaerobaculia bacterium]|nr:hypothetical protein [Thermoanaerobaculia bacterium]
MIKEAHEDFERNVFINCPFDDEYRPFLNTLFFVVVLLGFNPKISLESSDSGEQRIHKICNLIQASKYSIHDLSRLQSRRKNEFYRLNMPFELGIEYGCRHFSRGRLAEKRCLILAKKFDYVKALSDLSGVDIKSHGDDPIGIVREVRNWFVETVGLHNVTSPTSIWFRFNSFISDFFDKRTQEGFSAEDLNKMPVPEFVAFIRQWVRSDQESADRR